MKQYWSFLGLLAVAVFTPGCGPDIQGLCEKQENCLGGNDADVDACVAAHDGERDNANDIGCGDEYDAFIECLAPKFTCTTEKTCTSSDECNGSACVQGECKRYDIDAKNQDACAAQTNAYSRCN